MCAERCCLLAWLGLALCAPHLGSHTVLLGSSISVISKPKCMCAKRGCMHPCMAWLRVRPVQLQGQSLDLYFLSRAACAPSEATCSLGLASRTPRTATHTIPLSAFSEPNGTCAKRGHVYLRPGLVYVCMPSQTVSPGRAPRAPNRAACTLGLVCTHSSPIFTFRPVCYSALSEAVGSLNLTVSSPYMATHPMHHLQFLIQAAGTATELAACGLV